MKYNIEIKSDNRSLVCIPEFQINPGSLTLLLGESGIGKSLISKAIYGLLSSPELEVRLNQSAYTNYLESTICGQIQENGFFVFQEPSSHLNPLRTLNQQLNEGSIKDPSQNREILTHLFPTFSETEREQLLSVFPKPFRPSGGEKQRILIAMAFKKMALLQKNKSNESVLFVFDEPTGSLDNTYRNVFLKMLLTAQKNLKFTALLITHDYSMISEIVSNYPELLPGINFQELAVKTDCLVQKVFSPRFYLDWLGSVKPKGQKQKNSQKPLLVLNQNIQVFKRHLTISTEQQNGKPSPLEIYPEKRCI